MGCDIHTTVEVKNNDGIWVETLLNRFQNGKRKSTRPFNWRSYGLFGFLADVRNYSYVPCITGKRRGWPDDTNIEKDWNHHSENYVTLKELIDFNYDEVFENRRTTVELALNMFDGSADAGKGNGDLISFRTFLGKDFFNDIEALKTFGNPEKVRVLMSFDS